MKQKSNSTNKTENSSSSSKGAGNTKLPPKQISPSKKWCFTFNNWTPNEWKQIVPIFESLCKLGLVGEEKGLLGTPHLQGYVEFSTKCRPKSVIPNPRIHWEKARSNKETNLQYCRKEGHVLWSFGLPKPVKVVDPTYSWEQDILRIIRRDPHERKIYWYYGDGAKGKTSFCKYLTVKHGAIALGGKGSDIRNGILNYCQNNGDTPKLIVMNIPKSFDPDYISYEGIENAKDMYFFSGKYEGGMVCGNPPHLFVFANEPPNRDRLSEDRWCIHKI